MQVFRRWRPVTSVFADENYCISYQVYVIAIWSTPILISVCRFGSVCPPPSIPFRLPASKIRICVAFNPVLYSALWQCRPAHTCVLLFRLPVTLRGDCQWATASPRKRPTQSVWNAHLQLEFCLVWFLAIWGALVVFGGIKKGYLTSHNSKMSNSGLVYNGLH